MTSVAIAPAKHETFDRLLRVHVEQMPGSSREKITTAFHDAVAMYGNQLHWTGESLIDHCLGVLEAFLPFEPDDDGVIACLLHHVLDTKQWTLDELEEKYGSTVRSIVSGVHLLSYVTMENKRMSIENLRLMFLRVSDDIRVVLLILCDHNYKLAHMHRLSVDLQKSICRDVLLLFAPVAARLGIYSIKHQMESLAFPVTYPVDSARIAEQLEQIHQQHGEFLEAASSQIALLLAEAGIAARVEGREKQPYSIFQKMKQKSLSHVQGMYDLFAFRVIVDDVAACYQALGVLHRTGHPIAHRFKDYIGFPKPNGYQSLHTTLARLPGIPDGMVVEVQIRTASMHREAVLGIAAHWSYKEGGVAGYAERKAKLQRALSLQQPLEESKHSVLTDHIFTLTPNGDIIELPEGSTPLDFAFNVHTMLGLCFKGARVNGNIVPLHYHLENGDIVEIIKHKDPHASANWLNVLKTASAKSRLKRYLVSQNRPAYVQLGRESMNAELAKLELEPLDADLHILRNIDGHTLTFSEREDFLMKIGQGSQNAASLLPHIDALKTLDRAVQREQRRVASPAQMLPKVEGNIPMPVRYARCCKPDEQQRGLITGVIGRDGMVRVHRASCKMTRTVNPERRIKVRWVEVKRRGAK